MGQWIKVEGVSNLAPGRSCAVTAGGRRLAVFNDGGEMVAIDDTCPHQGASLAEGTFHERRVICPLHSWVFDVRTGRCPRDSHEPVAAYAVRCSDGQVEVQIPSEQVGD